MANPAPVAAETGLTSSAFGISATFRATGITVQVADPSLVTIVGLDGKPFAAVPANNDAPALSVQYKLMTDAELKSWLAAEQRNIGDAAPDGMKYAGTSPSTGTAMFAMPNDVGGGMSWNKAVEFTQTLVAHGHKGSKQATEKLLKDASKDDGGWRMPTADELNVLYQNKDKIGGFSPRWYWSSSEYGQYGANGQSFEDGYRLNYGKGAGGGLARFVRSLARDAR